VVLTGAVDHESIRREVRRQSLDDPDSPHFYRRVELRRQTRNRDGTWSDWLPVDPEPTLHVLDNIPDETEEQTSFLVDHLVDPLPVLRNGTWRGVYLERFVAMGARPQGVPGDGLGLRSPDARPRAVPPELMIRTFDFGVQPGHTYRYQARLVVLARARFARPGEWSGPWSEPAPPVVVP
jgi:hypothetical protein